MRRLLIPFLILLASIVGCTSDQTAETGPEDTNTAPRITSLEAASPAVMPAATTTLSVTAVDDDGDSLTYLWSADAGQFTSGTTSSNATWEAPSSPGTCTISVLVADGQDEAHDAVEIAVVATELAVSPTDLDFGTAVNTMQIGIANAGLGTLTWSISASQGWLSVTPASGSTTTGTSQVTVTVDRSNLTAGAHDASLHVISSAGEQTVAVTVQVQASSRLENLFFLHHSTGRNLIAEGDVRQIIADYNAAHGTDYTFWDHDYNYIGLMNPDGDLLGYGYNIPDDNTDPDGLYKLWTTSNSARTAILGHHQIIAFKSCFPASRIISDSQLAQYKTWYRAIRDVLDQHPDRQFLVMSPPPLHRLATNLEQADRARAFANWLGSEDFLAGHPNIHYFNFFDKLAHADDGTSDRNMLRYEYEGSHSSDDSHPNARANREVAPAFCRALIEAAGGQW